MPFFNLPNSQNSTVHDSGCPPGYVKVGNACINPLNQQIYKLTYSSGYDFEYYENAGELVGRYNIFANSLPVEDESLLGDSDQIANAATYFGQNINITKIKFFDLANPRQALSEEDSVLFLEVKHTDHGSELATVDIQHPFLPDGTVTLDPAILNTFYFGEFHLLTNTLKSIKRVNGNYQILQDMSEQEEFSYFKSGRTVDTLTIPSLFEIDKDTCFVELYFGYTKVSATDRPSILDRAEFPSIMNPITATNWLNWQTLNGICSNYQRVYNGTILSNIFEGINSTDAHHICQMKAIIDQTKLTTWFNANFDTTIYPTNTNTGIKEKYYEIILYAPSFYLYPAKNPSKIVEPIPNFVNNNFTKLIFQVPRNYKSDGNIQYAVEFFATKSDTSPIFRSSSYAADPNYESFSWFVQNNDGIGYVNITDGKPTDDNIFTDTNGTDAEDARYIQYILSEQCIIALKNKSDIIFKIIQFDGTLIEPYLNT